MSTYLHTMQQPARQLVDCKNAASWTPLHTAASLGNVEQVKALVDFGATVDATDGSHRTALLLSADMGKLAVAQTLLEKGAHINAADNKGLMPIHASCKNGHCDIVALLIEKGASVLSTDSSNTSALEHALAYNGYSDVSVLMAIQQAMKKKKEAESAAQGFALHRACQNASIEEIEKLVSEGAKLDELDKTGNSVLHYAAAHTNSEVLKALLAAINKKKDTAPVVPALSSATLRFAVPD